MPSLMEQLENAALPKTEFPNAKFSQDEAPKATATQVAEAALQDIPNINALPTAEQLQIFYHLVKIDFRHFLRASFKELNPGTDMVWNWHLDYICYTLMRTLPADHPMNPTPDDRLTRVIVNVPPRSLKSTIIAAYRAFIMGHYPHEKAITASYSGRLAQQFNGDTMAIMQSDWYQKVFPDTILTVTNQQEFKTSRRGGSRATSTGGTITGFGGNYIVADDLLDPEKAFSDTQRDTATRWFESTLYNRQNIKEGPNRAVILIIMQRLHENDVAGALLAKNPHLEPEDRWYHANLPAQAEETKTFHYYDTTYTYEKDAVLQPHRESVKTLQNLRTSMSAYQYAAQYQQRPAPLEGGLLNLEWFNKFDPANPPKFQSIVQSWDTAIKATQYADNSVCTTWGIAKDGFYLLDVFIRKYEFPELKAAAIKQAAKYSPNSILIEDKASGQQLIQELRSTTHLPIIPVIPKGDKVERLAGVSPIIESGNVFIPQNAEYQPWWDQFCKEAMFFPNATNDDVIDSISQFLNWQRKNKPRYRIRAL